MRTCDFSAFIHNYARFLLICIRLDLAPMKVNKTVSLTLFSFRQISVDKTPALEVGHMFVVLDPYVPTDAEA